MIQLYVHSIEQTMTDNTASPQNYSLRGSSAVAAVVAELMKLVSVWCWLLLPLSPATRSGPGPPPQHAARLDTRLLRNLQSVGRGLIRFL